MEMLENDIKQYLPQYLSDNAKMALSRSLDEFPENPKMYMSSSIFKENERKILQSDIFECEKIFNGENAKVMVISNSCDNSDENIRDYPVCVSFVIVLSLSKIKERLEKEIQDTQRVEDKIDAIKKQYITTMFYLPGYDMVAMLDRTMHLYPNEFKGKIIKKTISLNNYGFYVFLFKLSYHFTRLREGLQRD